MDCYVTKGLSKIIKYKYDHYYFTNKGTYKQLLLLISKILIILKLSVFYYVKLDVTKQNLVITLGSCYVLTFHI